jgi:hypothetical protein
MLPAVVPARPELDPDIAEQSVLLLGEAAERGIAGRKRKREDAPIVIGSDSEEGFPSTLVEPPVAISETWPDTFEDTVLE